ncbi:MAG TPA: cellulase family glycosylhydrolase [Mycobacteriales bacterium]|nr:cellulase family glycosylhydrolase [Mycobacteriales bacterium]
MSRWRRGVAAAGLAAICIAVPSAGAALPFPSHHAAKPKGHAALPLHVVGNHLANSKGQRVRLLGFNNSGAEYACIEGWGIFDVDTATNTSVPTSHVVAMAKWSGANAVRVSLNEQCWLGIGGVKPQYGGASYQHAIEAYVSELNAHGFAVILDLHNSAPGNESSLFQEQMPDAHSVTFWSQVAAAFKGNRSVLFDLFNEPWPMNQSLSSSAWKCWRDGGCVLHSQNGPLMYTAVGMNQLIQAVRSAGARNIVLVGGLNFASSLGEWLRYEPTDPDHEMAASIHLYSFGGCTSVSCYNGAPAAVAKKVPLVIGEFGADLTASYQVIAANCLPKYSGSTGFDKALIGWADAHGASWLAWTWNPWNNCLALVKNFAGAPTSPYGVRVKADLRADKQSHRA